MCMCACECAHVGFSFWPTNAFYGHAERQALRPQLGLLAPSTLRYPSLSLSVAHSPLLLFSFIFDFALETLVDVFAQLSIIIQNIQVSFMCVHSLVNPLWEGGDAASWQCKDNGNINIITSAWLTRLRQ